MVDELDLRILQQLEENARQSKSAVAQKLGVSKTLVTYRLNRLAKKGVIEGYQLISDRAKLGAVSYGLLIKFHGLFIEEEERLIRSIRAEKMFNWIASTNGRWDAVAVCVENDLHAFSRLLETFTKKYGPHIKEYNFYADYAGVISDHNYLYTAPHNPPVFYTANRKVILTETEQNLLMLLQKHPTMSLLRLAERLDKTYDTIKSHCNALQRKGIVLKTVPIINERLLGYANTICLLNLAPNPERITELQQFCAQQPHIVRQASCLGHINLLLNIHSQNNTELKTVIGALSKRFDDIIISYDLISVVDAKS